MDPESLEIMGKKYEEFCQRIKSFQESCEKISEEQVQELVQKISKEAIARQVELAKTKRKFTGFRSGPVEFNKPIPDFVRKIIQRQHPEGIIWYEEKLEN